MIELKKEHTMMTNKKELTAFDEFMADSESEKLFQKAYSDLVLSEILIALMEEDKVSVRELAKLANVSPTIIQELKSGKKENITLKNFNNIVTSMGYKIFLKKGKKQIPVSVKKVTNNLQGSLST